jgi:hypothetical protein
MGDLVALLQQQRVEAGQSALLKGSHPLSNLAVANGMAEVMGLTPLGDGKPPIREDLGRFQMYAEQALRMGLNGDMAERVVVEVKERGSLSPDTLADLRTQVVADTGWREGRAAVELSALEKRAAMLPDDIKGIGAMRIGDVAPMPAQITVNVIPPAAPASGLPVLRPPQLEMAGSVSHAR